jgi:hypothetical protein
MQWLVLSLSLLRFVIFAFDAGSAVVRTDLTALLAHVKAPMALVDGGWGMPGKSIAHVDGGWGMPGK